MGIWFARRHRTNEFRVTKGKIKYGKIPIWIWSMRALIVYRILCRGQRDWNERATRRWLRCYCYDDAVVHVRAWINLYEFRGWASNSQKKIVSSYGWTVNGGSVAVAAVTASVYEFVEEMDERCPKKKFSLSFFVLVDVGRNGCGTIHRNRWSIASSLQFAVIYLLQRLSLCRRERNRDLSHAHEVFFYHFSVNLNGLCRFDTCVCVVRVCNVRKWNLLVEPQSIGFSSGRRPFRQNCNLSGERRLIWSLQNEWRWLYLLLLLLLLVRILNRKWFSQIVSEIY